MKNLQFIFSGVTALVIVLLGWHFRPIWISSLSLSHQDAVDPYNLVSQFDPLATTAVFNNQTQSIPVNLAQAVIPEQEEQIVLGEQDTPKRIEIDLTNQRLYAYEGDKLVYNFLVSTGKWGRTPTGNFRIWTKLRYTKMSGGNQAIGTYYYLPNVPYVMFYSSSQVPASAGYSLHGTYWHNNFGHVMSHGCVNMRTEEAGQIYFWANPELNGKQSMRASGNNPGTEIVVYGEPSWD